MNRRLPIRRGGTGDRAGRSPSRWRKQLRTAVIAMVVAVIAISAVTARLFVWPDHGMPARVSAIVVLDRPGNSVSAALRLERQHRAPFLVISRGTPLSGYRCPPPISVSKLICFNPAPPTTHGEAEFIGRLARKYHWHSVAVVTTTPHASRAGCGWSVASLAPFTWRPCQWRWPPGRTRSRTSGAPRSRR